MRSLNKLADQVINSVMAGLKGTTNHPLSKRQIKDELVQMRNRLSEEHLNARRLSSETLMQTIPAIPVGKKEERMEDDEMQEILTGEFPKLLEFPGFKPVFYFGLADRHFPFKIMYGESYRYMAHERFSSQVPSVRIEGATFRIYNTYSILKKNVSIRAAFEDPRDCSRYIGFDDDSPFPMSDALSDIAVGKLVDSYIRYNRSQQPIINIATDPGINQGKR